MTGSDGWDERTEAIPGTKGDESIELDFDFDRGAPPTTARGQGADRPSLVIFEPAPLGLASTLAGMGYSVRVGTTGVDVMSLVATLPPAAVICAPAPDAERRRLLSAALRLRFPSTPVLYVSTHARQADAVVGATREGARAVIPWPLPTVGELADILQPFLDATSAGRHAHADDDEAVLTPARPIARSRAPIDEPKTRPEVQALRADELPSDALRPLPVPLPVAGPGVSVMGPVAAAAPTSEEQPKTQPGLRPAPRAGIEAIDQKRGEIGELLHAISPFLWSLEDAAQWADQLAALGDPTARNHARTLHLLSKILAQLQARIDKRGA